MLGIAGFIHFHQEKHHFSRPMSLHVSSCVSSSCPFQGVSLKKKTFCRAKRKRGAAARPYHAPVVFSGPTGQETRNYLSNRHEI